MNCEMCAPQTLVYAGQVMENDRQLREYNVPPVSALCKLCSLVSEI